MISWQLLNHWALWVIYGAAVAVFVALFFVTAPYGRHGRPGWGLTLPEKWGWGVMEFPSVALIVLAFVASLLRYGTPHPVSILLMLVWETHYIYRTFVFSSLMREGPKQFPVLIVVFALTFNTLNGFVNGYHLFFEPMQYAIRWLVDPRFLAGIVVFFVGFSLHVRSDRALRLLRAGGKSGYFIPSGGMFRYVSCPNYLGEMVEWAGWALLSWSTAGLAFAVFTFANLFPRALSNHRWYRETFGDEYPKERKAVIPFLV